MRQITCQTHNYFFLFTLVSEVPKVHSAIFTMSNFVEQRSAIKFCLRNDISAAETYRMLQKAFGEETMSQKNVYKWYKDFKEGRERVDDLERSGRPSTSIDDRHINKIKELVLANRRLTIRDLVDMVGISFGSVQAILKDHLGLRRLKSRLVPKFLNFFEKERRVKTCEAMLSDYQDVYKQIITGDETWVYAYDPETTDQSSEYREKGEPRPKQPRQSRSKIKVMLTVFFDYCGVVHYEFLPTGQTVNKEYYLSVMRRLREAIRKKRPELWANNSWILHHDNAPSHTALVLREFFAKNSTHVAPQPPYSPDLAPCDFWLFPKLKRPLRGNRFESIEEIQRESARALKAIPTEDFSACFEDWKKRWQKCIGAGGDYFEGDDTDLEE